jgi:hypothetical protein
MEDQLKIIQRRLFNEDTQRTCTLAEIKNASSRRPELSVCLSYYNERDLLQRHLEQWAAYGGSNVEFNIIDDGSEHSVELMVERFQKASVTDLSVYRIVEDIFWNISGVRNMGLLVSSSEWILFQDIDQYFTPENFEKLLELSRCAAPGAIYSFARPSGRYTMGTMLVNRRDLLRVHGHDESLVGAYGWNDQLLRAQMFRQGVVEYRVSDICVSNFGSSGYTTQDIEINRKKYNEKYRLIWRQRSCSTFNGKRYSLSGAPRSDVNVLVLGSSQVTRFKNKTPV